MSLPDPVYETKYDMLWVKIGNLWWSVENYAFFEEEDETPIPEIADKTAWNNAAANEESAYCWYNNTTDQAFRDKYGPLYNVFCLDVIKLPGADCRIPTLEDALYLGDFLVTNGYNWDGTTEGSKFAKSMASSGGEYTASATPGNAGNDQSSNNTSGFKLFPGGGRLDGDFVLVAQRGYFWVVGNNLRVQYDLPDVRLGVAENIHRWGLPIRIVRDFEEPTPEIKKSFSLNFNTGLKIS